MQPHPPNIHRSNGVGFQYTYNKFGAHRFTRLIHNNTSKLTETKYDSKNRVASRWYLESGNDVYSYDSLSRVTAKESKVIGENRTNSTQYTYEGGTGLVKNLDIVLNGSNERHTFTYNYDKKSKITSVSDGAQSQGSTYEYDELGQLIRENNTYASKTYIDTDCKVVTILK